MHVSLHQSPTHPQQPTRTPIHTPIPTPTPPGDVLHFTSEPVAHFNSLPPTKVLTLHMDVPEAWLVEATEAKYDLDNFKPQDLGMCLFWDDVGFDA